MLGIGYCAKIKLLLNIVLGQLYLTTDPWYAIPRLGTPALVRVGTHALIRER